MPGATFRVFIDNQPASQEQLDTFGGIRVEQAIGMAAAGEFEVPLATGDDGSWSGFDDPFMKPFARLRVEIRLGDDGAFVPLIDGPVVGQRYELRAGPDTSRVVLVVHDDSVLLDREEKVAVFKNKPLAQLVKGLIGDAGLTPRVPPQLPDAGAALDRWVVQRGTAMQLLRTLARGLGMFAWVEPGDAPGASVGVFGPPQAIDEGLPELLLLGDDRNLARFDVEFDGLRPQSPHAAAVQAIDKKALQAQAKQADDTAMGDEPAHGLLTPAATFLAHTREEGADLDAATRGIANLSAWAWNAHGEVDNDLYGGVLRPHRKVSVAGAGPQLSGEWMVSRVMHRIGDAAYRQSFSLVRNARSAGGGGGLSLPSVF
jgi:hypothetical protein